MKKLKLNKERIAQLSDQESNKIRGGRQAGGSNPSTNKNFTCCWCTSETGTDEPRCDTYQCSTHEPGREGLCPPDAIN